MSFDTGDAVQNVYHYKHTGSASITDAEFMTGIQSEMNTNYGAINSYISSALSYDTIEAFNVTQDAPIDEQAWSTLTLGAENTSQAYATQVAALVKFATAVARSQGRKYLAGLAETGIDGKGFLVTAVQTVLATFASGLVAGMTAGGESFVPGNWNPTLSRFAEWTAGIVADYVGTQRRRRVGSGA
jgi:hypothetical protein